MLNKQLLKRRIKYIWMLILHPILFFRFTITSNLFVGKNADIRYSKKMEVGKNVSFGYETRINFFENRKNSKKQLFVGAGSYICNRCSFIVGETISIGECVLIASDVVIVSHNHGTNPELEIPYSNQPLNCQPIKIENGVWIGEKVVVLPGVTIGEKSIVGAGAIVTKDIPPYCIAVGNPAKVIKKYCFKKHEWENINV